MSMLVLASFWSMAQQSEEKIGLGQTFDTIIIQNHYHMHAIDLMIDSAVRSNLDMYIEIQKDFITSHDSFMAHIYAAIALLVTILVMMLGVVVPYLINKRTEERMQEKMKMLREESRKEILELTKESEKKISESTKESEKKISELTKESEKKVSDFTRDAKQQIYDWESSLEKKDTIESSEPSAKTDCLSDRTKEAYRLYEEKRYTEAAEVFKLLSSEGNSAAQNSLGDMYYYGYGVEKDFNKARIQYELSAKQDNRDALYNLGIMYLNGIGVDVSRMQAIKYFAEAAENGSAISQRLLGKICQERNENEEAVHWYELAIENGDVDALRLLGYLYEKGLGVPQNENKAIAYYIQAENKGDIIARRRRKALEEKMPF